MNYVVIALYRITFSFELTYTLAFKLFSNERLTRVFLDTTAEAISDLCNQLKVFIQVYLPRLGQAMGDAGVETDFFAQTWLLTMLFHFQVNCGGKSGASKQNTLAAASYESQRVMQSLILDSLCLDHDKSLVKVPLCALQQLELTPDALEEVSVSTAVREKVTARTHSEDQSGNQSCNETITTQIADDESERLVTLIKRTASKYASGHLQLQSDKF